MKTKLNSKTSRAVSPFTYVNDSIKKTFLLILVLLALTPNITKAQTTGVLTGTGMGVCAGYSFASTAGQPTITPMNYGNQSFACTGLNDDDIAFNPQGNGWRVQIKSWEFIYNASGTATLSAYDGATNTLVTVTFFANDVLATTDYQLVGGIPCCRFILNNNYVTGTVRRATWEINAP
jgi:hypothetical protein